MTTLSGYINKGTISSIGVTWPQSMTWCRPQHKPTCCLLITSCNSCCMCVPTTATCFIIEMWGQGGSGACGCCCGVGSFGGQGGSYGWIACTTSSTNHILCACACSCSCNYLCNGGAGQFSKVCNCTTGSVWCVLGGAGGTWCCNPGSSGSYPWCWAGCDWPQPTPGKYNTWYHLVCKCMGGFNTQSSPLNQCLPLYTSGKTSTGTSAFTQSISAACTVNITDSQFLWPCICTCSCFTSPVYLGACGWSDPSFTGSPFATGQADLNVPNSNCGFGLAVGGAAYAGGDQAWTRCSIQCSSCFVQNGHFPGGGGMSAITQTATGGGGCGGFGAILISWC